MKVHEIEYYMVMLMAVNVIFVYLFKTMAYYIEDITHGIVFGVLETMYQLDNS